MTKILDKPLCFCYFWLSSTFLEAITMSPETQPVQTDQDLVCLLIEMLYQGGKEGRLWRGYFSLGQKIEVWLHRWLCPRCREVYPRHLQSGWGLAHQILAGFHTGTETPQLQLSAARQLRGIAVKVWPASADSEEAAPQACNDFVHTVWDAYIRHNSYGRR